jgi:hypothetical protein
LPVVNIGVPVTNYVEPRGKSPTYNLYYLLRRTVG